jgi:tetratricopeptide (TPR) repeat protein
MKPRKKKRDYTNPRVLEAERQRMSEQIQRMLQGHDFKDKKDLEKFMQGLVGEPLDEWDMPEPTPQDQAQDLCYDAWEEPSIKGRLKMAHQALALWPDCADAYLILAEGAKSAEEEQRLLEQAVAAGERAIGPEAFKETVGRFWGVHKTRPYMRARFMLAAFLWRNGQRGAAIGHAQELLRLNPNDNQGIRCPLVGWLLGTGDNGGAARLLERFRNDPTANMEYARLLLQYRNWGDTDKSRRMFRKALESNSYVPEYLLGILPMPKEVPARITMRGDDEAVAVVQDLGQAWIDTPGALEWLKECWLETAPGSDTTGH